MKLRAAPTSHAPNQLGVDRAAGRINGVAIIQPGEAKGHGVLIDGTMLDQVTAAGAAADRGIKARFTHPGMCADGLGTLIGHFTNFRRDGDTVRADLQLSDTAKKTPNGNLYSYVLDLADKEPARFGNSIVFSGIPVWKTKRGEIPINDKSLASMDGYRKPDDREGDKPFARLSLLHASDLVDEPAATTGGLFGFSASSLFAGTSSELSEQAFAFLDQLAEDHDITPTRLRGLLERYEQTRGITAHPKESPVLSKKLQALIIAYAASAPDVFAAAEAGTPEADIINQVLTKQLAAATEAHGKALAEKDTALAAAKAAHDKALAEKDAALAAAVKERDALKAQVAQFQGHQQRTGGTPDPGREPRLTEELSTGAAEADKAWSDPKVAGFFFGIRADFDAAVKADGLAGVLKQVQQ